MKVCGEARGFEAGVTETYLFEIGDMPARATTIIAKMKAEGVTSIIFLGDPLMPIYLTQQATAQDYHPEWIVTGTVLTDTTVLARHYDPEQWKHAFGLGNLAVRVPREQTEAWRSTSGTSTPPAAENTRDLILPAAQQMFLGIHLAGPTLSPETFRDGLFHYPESGGGPTAPHVSYGDHGYFKMPEGTACTSEKPRIDYVGIDDMAEIWWDVNATGPDEQGKTDKPGMWRFANNGKRYLPGTMPKTDTDAFKMENSATVLDKPPPEDTPPDYPSPPGSPAASKH